MWKECPDQSCPVVWQRCPAECVGCPGPQWRCLVVQCHTLRLRSPNGTNNRIFNPRRACARVTVVVLCVCVCVSAALICN